MSVAHPDPARPPKAATCRRRAFVFVGLAILAVYWPVVTFDFVRWDDDINVTQNRLLTEAWTAETWREVFGTGVALRFKPLHWLVAKGVSEVAGFQPMAWHGLGLALHLLTAWALFAVLRSVVRQLYTQLTEMRIVGVATGTTLFWALHPLRAEPVAWVTGSTYPLTGLCFVLSFWCYWRAYFPGNEQPGAARRGPRLVGAWLLAVAGYASYPVGLTFGLWLVLADLWLLRGRAAPEQAFSLGSPLWRRWFAKVAAFNAPAGLALMLTAWGRFTSPGIFTAAPTLGEFHLWDRVVMALASFAALLGRVVWPFGLTPNQAALPSDGEGRVLVLGLAAIAAAGLAGVLLQPRLRRRAPLQLLCWGSLALSLPCLGLTERPVWPVDRYSYLVHLFLIGGLGVWLGAKVAATQRLWVIGVVVILLLAGKTSQQLTIWQDSDTLFSSMESHQAFNKNFRQAGHVYVLWGRHAATQSRPADAARHFNRAQEVYLNGIKRALERSDFQEAFDLSTHIEQHFALTPVMRRERGAWLLQLGRVGAARIELGAAQRELPDDTRTRDLLRAITER